MINLTPDPITLIAHSGETTTIPASGYVALVESTRREVAFHEIAPMSGDPGYDSPVHGLFIVEETPTEIRFHNTKGFEGGLIGTWTRENPLGLLIVPREVAEAAHVLRHPLAERMVWVTDGIEGIECPKDCNMYGLADYICSTHNNAIGYRTLRRVPRGDETCC